ncbi:hypothetical protein B0H16DRAFT_483955 [Mycena metata]|uniref:Uncharacterized protein n=1 Tax=Mycena metata TaxID=1033252 RepID=A0AAD7P0P8_9AGAR|nr:hypothetical protein B0H16DRAFT_483955 [Mycena metata]
MQERPRRGLEPGRISITITLIGCGQCFRGRRRNACNNGSIGPCIIRVCDVAGIVYDLGFSCKQGSIRTQKRMKHKTDLLLFPQSKQTNAGDFHDLESHTGNITLRLTAATKARDEDLVVLVHKVEATIVLRPSDAIQTE